MHVECACNQNVNSHNVSLSSMYIVYPAALMSVLLETSSHRFYLLGLDSKNKHQHTQLLAVGTGRPRPNLEGIDRKR